jgi:hypothetical protein
MSVPEPSAGLILSAIRTAGGGVWKLWQKHLQSRETRDLLRRALAWAICPARRADADVCARAVALEERLRATPVPQPQRGFGRWAAASVRRMTPRRLRRREAPAASVFGTSFQERLEAWLRSAIAPSGTAEPAPVACPGYDVGPDAVVERFSMGFQLELLRDDVPVSPFREALASELLSATDLRRRRGLQSAALEHALLAGTRTLAAGGIGYGVAEAAGAHSTTAVLTTLAASGVGALSASIARDGAGRLAAARSNVRGIASGWLAELVGVLGGRRTSPQADELQRALFAVLRNVATQQTPLPPPPERLRCELPDLHRLAVAAHDDDLARALSEVDAALAQPAPWPQGLGAVVDLYNVAVAPVAD